MFSLEIYSNDELLNNNIFNRQKFFFHEFFPKIISISIPFKRQTLDYPPPL